MNRLYLHYGAALAALLVLCIYIIPNTASKPQGIKKIIHIYKYPHNGHQQKRESGYIAVYYALQKLGLMPDDIPEYIAKSRKLIVQQRLKKGLPANGDWLHRDEVAYLLDKGTPKKDTVKILDDFGVVALQQPEQEAAYHKVASQLEQEGAQPKSTHIFIADKSYEPGDQDKENAWVTIIANRYNNTIRYAIIDPENTLTEDDPHIETILRYID